MVFINSVDDPIVPESLLTPVKELAGELQFLSEKYLYVISVLSLEIS